VIDNLSVINIIDNVDIIHLCNVLKQSNIEPFIINGEPIYDGLSFVHYATDLPLDPPLVTAIRMNIDALLDSLEGGIWGLIENSNVSKIAFIWTRVANIYQHSPGDFFRIIDAFQQLAKQLVDPEYKMPKPVELFIFLLADEQLLMPLKEKLHITIE
jgi:hypothetical protein